MGKITGVMNIDEYGRRQDFNIKILSFRQADIIQTGSWNSTGFHPIQTEKEQENYLYKSMQEKQFKISIKIVRIKIVIVITI